jgi:hypothetical protein
MKVTYHAAASAVLGTVAYFLSGAAFACGLALFGALLDVDHIEHYRSRGMPVSLKGLFGAMARSQQKLEKIHGFRRGVPASWAFPVLHSVELLLFAGLLTAVSGKHFLAGATAGTLIHLLMDIRAYPMSPKFFSLVWRAHNWRRLRFAWKTWKAD